MTNGVTVIVHYPITDPQMTGDYYDVTVDVTLDNKRYHMDYGDYYHDKGTAKAEGFIDALRIIYGSKFPVIRGRQADRDEV